MALWRTQSKDRTGKAGYQLLVTGADRTHSLVPADGSARDRGPITAGKDEDGRGKPGHPEAHFPYQLSNDATASSLAIRPARISPKRRREDALAANALAHKNAATRRDDGGTRPRTGNAARTANAPGLGFGRFDTHSHGNCRGSNRREEQCTLVASLLD